LPVAELVVPPPVAESDVLPVAESVVPPVGESVVPPVGISGGIPNAPWTMCRDGEAIVPLPKQTPLKNKVSAP
jgi:hypothetical protein